MEKTHTTVFVKAKVAKKYQIILVFLDLGEKSVSFFFVHSQQFERKKKAFFFPIESLKIKLNAKRKDFPFE